MGRMQGDETHPAIFHAVDDLLDVPVGDLAMTGVPPPDEHIGLFERCGRNALLGVSNRGRHDFPSLGFERLKSVGYSAVDIVRIDVFRSGSFRPYHYATLRLGGPYRLGGKKFNGGNGTGRKDRATGKHRVHGRLLEVKKGIVDYRNWRPGARQEFPG